MSLRGLRRLLKTASRKGRRRVKTGGVPAGYVEDVDEPRTTREAVFSRLPQEFS